ncbi:MAG: AAA family ATPase [Candidatus Altiarchaeota archaeon]
MKTVGKGPKPNSPDETDDERLFRQAFESITLRDVLKNKKDPTHGLGRRMLEEAEARGQTLTDDEALSLLEDRDGFEMGLKEYGKFEPRAGGPKVFLLLGVSGAGKTLSTRKATELLGGEKIVTINFGDEMQNLTLEEKNIRKGQIKDMSPVEQERLRVRTAKKVAKMCDDPRKAYCIESHATLYGKNGFIVSLDSEAFNTIRPNAILMVSQDPELILEKRPGKDLTDKKVHQKVDETIIRRISEASGVSLHVVRRKGPGWDRNSVSEIAHLIYSDNHRV